MADDYEEKTKKLKELIAKRKKAKEESPSNNGRKRTNRG